MTVSTFVFVGPQELYYAELGFSAAPGDHHDFDEQPDLFWVPATDNPTPADADSTQE